MNIEKDFGPKIPSVAIAYLARKAEGIAPLRKFADSYVQNPAGIKHDLVVIYKGYGRGSELDAAKQVFSKIQHIAIEVSDEGFDINAYFKAARVLNQDYVCFLNTFTEIVAPHWLAYLYRHATSPRVGIVGVMGSYESFYDSSALIQKVLWLCNILKISYQKKIAYYYDFIVDMHCQAWKKTGQGFWVRLHRQIKSVYASVRQLISVLIRQPCSEVIAKLKMELKLIQNTFGWEAVNGNGSVLRGTPVDGEFRKMWEFQVSPKGAWSFYSKFPPFPNPHIRSNGFMIARDCFLRLNVLNIRTKIDAVAFESGAENMTNQIKRQGMKAIVVGRSGQGFDVADWPRSGTFRIGNQENLLITDNQSRNFDKMTPGAKATHARMTWGDYLAPAPSDFPDLSFKFAINESVTGSVAGRQAGPILKYDKV